MPLTFHSWISGFDISDKEQAKTCKEQQVNINERSVASNAAGKPDVINNSTNIETSGFPAGYCVSMRRAKAKTQTAM
jgi:hypothetical protein